MGLGLDLLIFHLEGKLKKLALHPSLAVQSLFP